MTFNKLYFCACLILIPLTPLHTTDNEKIITESAKIAEDITGLIIACKKTKDAKLITEIVKKLLLDTAQLTESIIEKRKQKKAKKSISLDTFSYHDIASNPLEHTINNILVAVHTSLEQMSFEQDME